MKKRIFDILVPIVSKIITHDWDQNYSRIISPLKYFFSRISLLEEVRGTKYVHNIFREDKKEAFYNTKMKKRFCDILVPIVSKKITHDWDQNYSRIISPLKYFFSRISLLEEVRGTKYVHNIFREDKKEAF